MYVDIKSTKWSIGLTVYVCANNRQRLCSNVLSISLTALAIW